MGKPPPTPENNAPTIRRRSPRLSVDAPLLPATPEPTADANEATTPPDDASQSGEAEAEADEPEAEPPIANPDTNINWTGVAAPSAINPNIDDGDDSDSDSDYDDDEECNEMLDLERDEDLGRQILSEADRRLMAVYGGDSVHQNDGRTLHGGIESDAATCMLYDELVNFAHKLYSPPQGKVGDVFLKQFARMLAKVRRRECNSELALIFPIVILRKETGVSRCKHIRARIKKRMKRWRDGKVAELVEDTVATARRGEGGLQRDEDDDSTARRYHSMVIGGRLRGAVRMLTNRDGGGVLHPEETDAKSGRKVIEVLREKHPELMIPDLEQEGWASFEKYDTCKTTIPVDCTEEIVSVVAGKLGGGAGPGSVDAIALKS